MVGKEVGAMPSRHCTPPHDGAGQRVCGMDNAHGVRRQNEYDHRHLYGRRKVVRYRYRGPAGSPEFGWPIGMPLCRPLGNGLWEVRSTLPSRRIARRLFFAHEGRIGVVHGFIKKTQKTPVEDLDLARRRMKEMQKWARRIPIGAPRWTNFSSKMAFAKWRKRRRLPASLLGS
jgi:hypothetical protein